MDVARNNTLARIQKCCTIMGRKETDAMSAGQIFYPCMQVGEEKRKRENHIISSRLLASNHDHGHHRTLHAVRRCLFLEGKHLPVGHGPEEGQYARPGVRRNEEDAVQTDCHFSPHAYGTERRAGRCCYGSVGVNVAIFLSFCSVLIYVSRTFSVLPATMFHSTMPNLTSKGKNVKK